jgi:sugar/nucleoside kinase (ribokinase family)
LLGGNPAGTAANSAAQAAVLGEEATLIARLGEDELGDRYRRCCMALPTLSTVWLPPDGPTKLSINLITPDGERTLISASQASSEIAPSDLTPEVETILADTDILWVTTTKAERRWLYAEACPGKRGLPLQHFSQELHLHHQWDYVVGSVEDGPTPNLDDLQAVELCVLTAGAAGGMYSQAGAAWQEFTATDVVPVVDTCGAGDAFLGGLLAGLHRKLSAEEALVLASKCGAAAVGRRGSWPLPV